MTIDIDALRARLQQAVQDEFEVADLLGAGGFAGVFRARDPMLGRDVAIKVLDPRLAANPEVAERFLNEARTIAAVEHPHIIPIYDVEAREGLLYLVMRYLPGQSLGNRLKTHGSLPPAEAARIAREVAEALHAAHLRGVVHRDIKPDNILLDGSGHAVVTDFGISRATEAARLTMEGVTLGTPHYMSPEQAAGEDVDGRSDIYALGIVLYEMLSGKPPFEGKTAAQVMAKHLSQQVAPLPNVPVQLDGVLTRALAKAPGDRYGTAADLAQALVTAATPVALESRGRQRWRRARRWMTSLGLVAVGGVLVLAAFIAGAIWLLSNPSRGEPPALNVSWPTIPPALITELRQAGLVQPDDSVRYLFAPHGAGIDRAMIFTPTTLIHSGPAGVSRRPLSNLDINLATKLGFGSPNRCYFIVSARGSKVKDTLFAELSTRELSALQDAVSDMSGYSAAGGTTPSP